MEALWTIVTPTMGRKSLLHLKEVLKQETIPYVHFVMMDSKRDPDGVSPEEIEDERTFVYNMRHPLYPKQNERLDCYLRATGIMMARTPFIRCCDDDVWPEPGHLSRVTRFMQNGKYDFVWCKRRMLTRDKEVIGIDNFEAIGEKNQFGYHLLDNSSLFYNQKAAFILAQVFLRYPFYGEDRLTWDPLHNHCKGGFLNEVLTNHMAQPNLTEFFRKNCTPEV